MFIRFQGAILLAALIAVAGSALEKSILEQRRALSRQHFRIDVLRERVARLRLRIEQSGSPAALARPLEEGRLDLTPSAQQRGVHRIEPPLLRWRIAPEGRP